MKVPDAIPRGFPHRVETDGTPGAYTAWCLGCSWTARATVLSDAWRACNQHLDDTTPPQEDDH